MIISKKKGKFSKFLCGSTLVIMLGIAGSAMAATNTSVATITPGLSKATGVEFKAEKTSGYLSVESSHTHQYVTGYAKKKINWWPDSNVQSASAYYNSPVKDKKFTADKDSTYYAQANTGSSVTNIYGYAKIVIK